MIWGYPRRWGYFGAGGHTPIGSHLGLNPPPPFLPSRYRHTEPNRSTPTSQQGAAPPNPPPSHPPQSHSIHKTPNFYEWSSALPPPPPPREKKTHQSPPPGGGWWCWGGGGFLCRGGARGGSPCRVCACLCPVPPPMLPYLRRRAATWSPHSSARSASRPGAMGRPFPSAPRTAPVTSVLPPPTARPRGLKRPKLGGGHREEWGFLFCFVSSFFGVCGCFFF